MSFRQPGSPRSGLRLPVLLLAALALVAADAPRPGFEDVTARAGVAAPHHNRQFHNPYAEIMAGYTALGAAAAVADFDGDGWEDVLVTDSAETGKNHLYRNRFGETGELTFVDVGRQAGVADGNDPVNATADALWLDYDNDGRPDLFVVRFGHSQLFHDLGNGRFQEVTKAAGLDRYANAITAIAFDYDRDGRLDLLVGNYFQPTNLFHPDTSRFFPESFETANNGGGVTLWHNNGKGTFTDVTQKAGLVLSGWTLDVGHGDFDNDGDDDLYVACDFGTDRFFVNNGDGTFTDRTKAAVGIDTKKGMNAEWGDYDNDGLLDVFVTNITDDYMREGNFLWRNNGDGTFSDVARETGVYDTGWGWGAKLFDYDDDGWLDLYVVNGWVSAGPESYVPDVFAMITRPNVDLADARSWPPMGKKSLSGYQKKKLFHNQTGSFRDEAARHGVDSTRDGRGVAVADFDGDGRLDLFVANANAEPYLYRNAMPPGSHWAGFLLEGRKSNRDAVGAQLRATAGGRTQLRFVDGGNGFAGQSSRRVHFGLAGAAVIDRLEVRWPSGARQTFEKIPAGRLYRIVEGEALLLAAAPPGPSKEELLWHHRNLGKAFYENPTTQYQAVEELKAALDLAPGSARERLNYGLALLKAGKTDEGIAELVKVQAQDPSIPHTWFNLGIAYKRASDYDRAIAQFEKMVTLVPGEPVSHYNLGTLYKLTGKPDAALREFEAAARLGPGLAGPRFQLYNAYKAAGREEDSKRELKTFQELKKQQEGAAVPEDLEWSWYSELWDEPTPASPPSPPAEPKWETRSLATGIDPATAVLTLLDADGDGRPDLLATSAAGAALFLGGTSRAEATGLEGLQGITGVAAGDYDNDGLADLCVVADGSATLWHSVKGKLGKVPLTVPAGVYRKAVWLDFDHDYDQDLVLLGDSAALLRNEGAAGWSDETKRLPFMAGKAVDAALLHAVSDTQGFDLAVSYEGRPGVIYRDRLGGTYEAETVEALPAGATPLAAFDVDADGWTDLAAGATLLKNLKGTGWKTEPAPAAPFVLADLDNRGIAILTSPPFPSAALAAADFGTDRRLDLAAVLKDGSLKLFRNVTGTTNRWLAVGLQGVKNLALAPGAEVEVKAGAVYRKQLYHGTPLLFGLGDRSEADTVRITWPNGLIQNETKQAAGRLLAVKEAPRLSGSCPMIFTWNGERFQLITDVLGVAPLGASAGDGEYFPVDHDEYVQIPGEALVPLAGSFEVRITEELREVSYLDQIHLIAVDHPESVEIFTNDKFKSPPFPEFRLFGVERKVRPVAAREDGGRDVRDRLLARDQRYPDGFRRSAAGVAELHHLDLDFGASAADGKAVLILSGWVDWADGSTFLAAAQESPGGLVMPRLQVKDAAGRWVTVIEDMGIPSGKPKTISVDLTGKFLSASREVRIETSLCVYWDEIFLSEQAGEPPVALTELAPETADLRFRGFSRPVIHPERKQPESFDYQTWMPVSEWNPTPGLYTRYGDVRELLAAADDRLVLMGSGDEVRLRFAAATLPSLPAGWRRDFLLLVDGWAKDADANTAFSQSVEPLPFHAMSRYPYPAGEHFPDDALHRLYRERYNTRPALRLIRPLRDSE